MFNLKDAIYQFKNQKPWIKLLHMTTSDHGDQSIRDTLSTIFNLGLLCTYFEFWVA